MLISAFTNEFIKITMCFLTLVNALWTNMNKPWTTVFLLTNINKDLYINKAAWIKVIYCIKYYINKRDMTGLYWSTLLKSRAPANIHIIVIRCIFNCCFECFHTAVSFCCVSLLRGKRAIYIYISIQTPLSSFRFVRLGLKRCLLLNCIQEGWTIVLRSRATLVKLQYCKLLH